jgi:GR25 family glycosyltransferase involved in LPS biosynthesis
MNPDLIVQQALKSSKTIRFFEPINVQALHSLSLEFFNKYFGNCVDYYPRQLHANNFHDHESAYGIFNIFTAVNSFKFKDIPKYCINLKRSTDRKTAVSKQFKKFQIDVNFSEAIDKKNIKVPALSTKNAGIQACMESHVALIRMAKEKGYSAICIFEDDVLFCDDFWARIKYIENLPLFEYDMLYLGGHFTSKNFAGVSQKTQWPHILKALSIAGGYAYIITDKVYDFVLENIHYNYGIDEFYAEAVCKHFNCFAFVPFLVSCAPGFSMITDAYSDYDNIYWFYQQGKMEF